MGGDRQLDRAAGVLRQFRVGVGYRLVQELEIARFLVPGLDHGDRHPGRSRRLFRPASVLGDAHGREMRRQHDADDPLDPALQQFRDRVLDEGGRVLLAHRHREPAGIGFFEGGCDSFGLGLGDAEQR